EMDVQIADDDAPGVLVLETLGKTFVIEPTDLVARGQGFVDTVKNWDPDNKTVVFSGDFGTAVTSEVGVHDSVFNAQDLDAAKWNQNADPNIEKATDIPHLTVLGTGDFERPGDVLSDFYKFNITSKMIEKGGQGIFDIDFGFENSGIFWWSLLRLYKVETTV